MANNFTDSKSLDGEGLSLYDALVKHWAGVNDYTYATDEQIDELFTTKLVPWSTGTDEEIATMINNYYEGSLTLEQIQSVWNVGDSRTVNLTAMEATGVGESHRQQDVELMILDFDHDELVTSINNKSKALITVNLKDCLMDTNSAETGYYPNTETGYVRNDSEGYTTWERCSRRTWCNTIFYNALPDYLKNIIKLVNKNNVKYTYNSNVSGHYENEIIVTQDKIFLLSHNEVCGPVAYYPGDYTTYYNEEGPIYEYFIRYDAFKKPARSIGYQSADWALRSLNGVGVQWYINYYGRITNMVQGNLNIAPAFCL